MYNLKTNSRAAKFYEWVWNTDVTNFKTMCPYFWGYVLTILFLPLILLGKFIYHVMPAKRKVSRGFEYVAKSKFGKGLENTIDKISSLTKFWNFCEKVLKWIFFIMCGAIVLGILIGLGLMFWTDPKGGFSAIGFFVVFVGALIGIAYLFDEYSLGRKITAPFRLFGTMIKSLYHNLCPLIKWN